MNKNILVVDADASVRKSLGNILRDAGYQVREAADGAGAVEQFEMDPVDLLLLDISPPVRNGWEAFERITRQSPVLPIIIITGKANQYDMALVAGVGALMEKPLDVAQLLKTIEELLSEPKETRLRRLSGYNQHARNIPPAPSSIRQKLHG